MLDRYEKQIYSQNGEDGITEVLLKILYKNDVNNKYFVEFGVENGMECNTRILREKYGWRGLMMDGSNQNDDINLQKEFIHRGNIVDLFKKYRVPTHINYLCVDIDSNDFYCVDEILKSYTTDILVCEYNGTHLPHEDKVIKYRNDFMWDGSNYFGTSLLAITKLCNKHGYSLVYCDNRGVNSFFVRNKILDNLTLTFENVNNVEKLYNKPQYSIGPNGGHPDDHLKRAYITSEEAVVYENDTSVIPKHLVQNPECKMNIPPTIRLTYSVQVCNESRELYSLLSFLIQLRSGDDDIDVVVDSNHKTEKVQQVLDQFKKHIRIFERPFDNFKDNSQYHTDKSRGEYIFGIDADEMPQEALMKNIKHIITQTDAEIIFIPRINIHPGLTSDFIRWSGFNVNENGWINWPDYQGRIWKNCDYIKWSDETHTKLTGTSKIVKLQPNPQLAMWHIKSMEKQKNRWGKDENDQFEIFNSPNEDNLYDKLM